MTSPPGCGLRWLAILIAVGCSAPAVASGGPGERVALLTMGRGELLFARFGHAALAVVDVDPKKAARGGLVYNYGYTHFDQGLAWRFLRGRARFWVSLASTESTLRQYHADGRAVTLHLLALAPAQHRELARLLQRARRPENRYYTYHHYDDNCATRLRDLLDQVLGGELARRWRGELALGGGLTFRALTREGFAGRIEMLLLTELVGGRSVDRPIDRWQAAFLPRLLVEQLGEERLGLGGRPVVAESAELVPQRQVMPAADPLAGVKLLWAIAGLLSLLAGGAALGIRRRRRWAGLLLLPQGLVVGLCGLLIAALTLVSTIAELHGNELLLSLWPTDLLVWPWLAVRLTRGRFFIGRLLRGYLLARVVLASLVPLGHVVGLLYQQPRPWLLLVWLPSLLTWLALRRLPPPPAPASAEATT